MSVVRNASLFAMLAAFSGGCPGPQSPPPPPTDAGVITLTDSGPDTLDTDGDGLCDATEIVWGTDPNNVDSDLDGLSDRAEADFGYEPLAAGSPERDVLVFMDEGAGATAQLPVEVIVRGQGESYAGGFQALPLPIANRLEYDATTFLERSQAVGANPMENVFEVRPDEERFLGVFGRTQLTYEIRFAFGTATPRSCVTAFPFRYEIKREDGRLVGFGRYLLLLLPAGQRLENSEWCAPEGACI